MKSDFAIDPGSTLNRTVRRVIRKASSLGQDFYNSTFVRHLVEILSWIITSSLLLNVKVKLLPEKSTGMCPFLILASEAPHLTFGQCPKENISPPGSLP